MNRNSLKSILQNRAEDIAPGSEIDLWPSIQKHFTSYHAVLPNTVGGSKMKGKSINVKVIVPIMLALIFLASIVAFTPIGHALANTVIRFFTTTDQTSFPVPTSQPPITSSDAQTYLLKLVPAETGSSPDSSFVASDQSCEDAALLTYACRIKSAEEMVGFDVKEFPVDPQGLTFSSVEAISVLKEIIITYDVIGGGGLLDFEQGIGAIQDGLWGEVPADAVEDVLIGNLPGEYVQGMFTSDGSGEATWNPDAPVQRLRWQDGERWFSLEKNGDPYPIEYLRREEMITLAVSLVDNPPQNGSQLRADHLTSIMDAEKISGINLQAPILLPEGFTFNFAQYDDQAHSVRLVYNNTSLSDDIALYIMEIPLKYAEGLEEGYYEEETYQTLSWRTNELYIAVIFMRGQWFNGQLNEASLTEIANSMR